MAHHKTIEIEMWRGKPRYTFRDTPKGIYRLDRKIGKEAYIWLGGSGKPANRRKRGKILLA